MESPPLLILNFLWFFLCYCAKCYWLPINSSKFNPLPLGATPVLQSFHCIDGPLARLMGAKTIRCKWWSAYDRDWRVQGHMVGGRRAAWNPTALSAAASGRGSPRSRPGRGCCAGRSCSCVPAVGIGRVGAAHVVFVYDTGALGLGGPAPDRWPFFSRDGSPRLPLHSYYYNIAAALVPLHYRVLLSC
jgi:hypothetical protein